MGLDISGVKLPPGLLEKIMDEEGFRSEVYDDGGGTATIGFGFTRTSLNGKDGRPHFDDYKDGMTKEQGKEILEKFILPRYVKRVQNNVTNWNELTPAMQIALVDTNYRSGIGNMVKSGIFDFVNKGDWEGVANVLETSPSFKRVGGEVKEKGDGFDGIHKRNSSNAEAFKTQTGKDPNYRHVTQQQLGEEGFIGYSDLIQRMGNNDFTVTSAMRDKTHKAYRAGSKHSEGNAIDFGVRDGEDGLAYMNFFFGPEATFKTNPEDLTLTEEGRQYLIDNNAELLDERGMHPGGDEHGPHPHFHLEFNTPEDGVPATEWTDDHFQNATKTKVGDKDVVKWGVDNKYYVNSFQQSDNYNSYSTQFTNLQVGDRIDIASDTTAGKFFRDLSLLSPKQIKPGSETTAANEALQIKSLYAKSEEYQNAATNNPLTEEEINTLDTQITQFAEEFLKRQRKGEYKDVKNDYQLGNVFIQEFTQKVLGLGMPTSERLEAQVNYNRNKGEYKGLTDAELRQKLIEKNRKEVSAALMRGANPNPFIFDGFEGMEDLTVQELGKLQNMTSYFAQTVSKESFAEKIQLNVTGSKNGDNWMTAGLWDTSFEDMIENLDPKNQGDKPVKTGFARTGIGYAYTGALNRYAHYGNPYNVQLKNNPNVAKTSRGGVLYTKEGKEQTNRNILENNNLTEDVESGKTSVNEKIAKLITEKADVVLPEKVQNDVTSLVEQNEVEINQQRVEQGLLESKPNRDKLLEEFGAYVDEDGDIISEDYIVKDEKFLKFDQYKKKYPKATKQDYQNMLDNAEYTFEEYKTMYPKGTREEYDKRSIKDDQDGQDTGETFYDLRGGDGAFKESFLDKVGGISSLIGLATGAIGLGAALKDVDIPKDPKLGPAFQQRLQESKRLAQQGLTPTELAKAHNDLDSSYATGIDNIVRGSAGNRAQFMAGLGGLDVARQSALMDIAVADAQMQRQNQEKYDSMMLMNEQYEAARQAKYQDSKFQQDTARQAAGAALAGSSIAMISDAIGSRHINRYHKMQSEKLLMDMGFKGTKNGESGQDPVGTDKKGNTLQTKWNLLDAKDQSIKTDMDNKKSNPVIQGPLNQVSSIGLNSVTPSLINNSQNNSLIGGTIDINSAYSNSGISTSGLIIGPEEHDTFEDFAIPYEY